MVDSIKICIPQHIKTNSTNIKTWISDVSYASTAVNSVKQATTTTAYANAVKNLSLRQAELALSTKNLTVEQQREILVTAGLIKETGTLTVAQATEALTTDTRNAADVEALMLKAGLITELGAETTATITVDAAKLKELVDTKVLTQAEAELLAMKAGVTLQSTKEAATLIASNAKLGSSFAIMGKTAGAALKGIGKGLLSFASAHPILAIGATIIGSVAFFNSELKKLKEEQEELISNAKALQEEYRNFTKDTSGKINSLTSQADEFNELSKGVDKYGNNISLASDEYDRYKSIVAEILGYSPELIQGYDAEGNAIADKNGLLERSIELLKEEQRLKLKEMTTDEKTGEAYDAAEAGWQQVQGYEGANTRNEIARWFDDNALRGGVNYEVDIAKVLGIKDEWKEEGNNLQNAIINNIDTVVKNIKDKKEELLAISDSDGNAIFSVDEIDNMIDLSNDWQYAYNQWQQDIEDAKHGMDDQFDLYAQRAKSYNDLTDAQKVFVNEYIRATGDITDAEGHLLSEDKILEKAKGYEKFVNEFAELNKLGEGGSVDLTFRPEIDTEELNKKGWEAGEGFATVFSSAISNTDFDDLIPENAEDTVAINFTPIIVDPNTGEFKGVLSEEELYAYAHDVLSGVREDDLNLQIGAKFEGKNAIDEAVADGERIHYLHEKLFINNDTVDSWEELRKVLVKTGDDAVQAGENVNKMTVSLSELEKTSDNIKTLASAFKELSDDGYITTKTLGEIKTATGLADDEWEEYETRLLSAKKGSSDFNQVMSDLTYKILDATFKKEGLVDVTEDEVAAVLRENGVSNASAVAHDYLARTISSEEKAKAENSIRTRLLSGDIAGLIKNLSSEATACGLTETAFKNLAIQMVLTNETNMSFDDQIANLKALGVAAEITAAKMAGVNGYRNTKYSEKRNARGNMDSRGGLITSVGQETINGSTYIVYYGENGQIVDKEKIGVDYDNLTTPKIPTYTSDGKSGSGSDNKPDYEDPTEAIINRINLRSKELEQQEEQIQNLIEIAELENDYKKQISSTNDLIATRKKRVEELNKANDGLHNEAQTLRDANPWDEDSWFDSQGNATEAYYDLYNSSSKADQEKIKNVFESISKIKEAWVANDEELVELNKQLLQDAETLNELYSSQHENTIRDIEHARDMALKTNPFTDTTSYYRQLQEEYHREAERLRALDPEKYKEEIQELKLAWWEAQESIADWSYSNSERWISERNTYNDWDLYGDNEVAAWERVLKRFKTEFPNELEKIEDIKQKIFEARKDAMEQSLEEIDKYISARNEYNDWSSWGDSEIAAIRRQMAVVKDAFKQQIISLKEYNEKISEYKQSLHSVAKNALFQAVEKEISNLEEAIDREKELLDLQSSKYSSLKSLLQSYYDVVNSISDAQHEINKELNTSKTLYEYLNEETRKLLFNEKDYKVLNETLLSIQQDADRLQEKYNNEILNATKDNLDEITSKYEMQYETLMKSYEIAKADLEVAKKKQQLNNVLKERNVSMFINGRWQWVANTKDVENAQNELADAEYQKNQAETSLEQTNSLNKFTEAQDEMSTQINNLTTDLELIRDRWSEIQEQIEGESTAVSQVLKEIATIDSPALRSSIGDVNSLLSDISDVDAPLLKDVISGTSTGLTSFTDSLQTAIKRIRAMVNSTTSSASSSGLSLGSINKYATGTKNTKPGTALMGEDGKEIYIDNNGHYIPIEQPTLFSDVKAGGTVFNQDQMKSLHELWDMSKFVKMPDYSSLVNRYDSHNTTTNNDYSVTIKDLVVDNSADGQALANAIRRYVAVH